MPSANLVSTDDVPARERAPMWRDWIWTRFGGLESDLYGDRDFDGHMATAHAGHVVLTKLEANRHRVIRSRDLGRKSDEAYLKIVAPTRGRAGVEQLGRQAWVGPNSWAIYDTTGSYAVGNPERVEHLIVMVPKSQLVDRGLRLDSVIARPIAAVSGIARVALTTMRSTFEELPAMSADTARGAGELITQLVHLSLLELAGRPTACTQRQALKDRIRSHVTLHLRDPALNVDQIAQALNCSKRHLYNAFADEHESLAGYIQRQRLEACIRDLKHRDARARAITDIALSWGFSNPSHFSRVFRDHTGRSPSEFRNQSPA